MKARLFAAVGLLLPTAALSIAQPHPPVAPPPATPIVGALPSVLPQGSSTVSAGAAQLYSIGDPTDQEQLYLELINRARANPTAEGARLANTTDPDVRASYTYFGVNLTLMQSQFAAIAPLPPLSMNATLLTAARAHSQNMLQFAYQSHEGPDGSLATRLAKYLLGANGYAYGENIFAYAKSVFYGHAGFEVDWGGTLLTGGMQTPPGHRNNIHGIFREIGVGVVNGTNGSIGPQLVTQDFGLRYDTGAFITGVVYRDANGNGFFDPGEGVGGVTVEVAGAAYYAMSAAAGGYSVPVPRDGAYTVTFSRDGIPTNQQIATVSGMNNVKLDYIVPPVTAQTPAVLANISTRAVVGTGENVLIGGFIVTGTESKKVIVRAIGPSMSLPGKLMDPMLQLYNSAGAMIASNNDWKQTQQSAISATGLQPSDDRESAILSTLAPGSYTAVVTGAANTTGSGLVEVYDVDRSTVSRLANISTRALVKTDDGVLIGGLIVLGDLPLKVVVRAIGPSLPISGALADPTLELRDANGALVRANDDWRSAQEAAISATGLAPTKDHESAILATLSPAAYTAIVRGANNTSGIALVEVYSVN